MANVQESGGEPSSLFTRLLLEATSIADFNRILKTWYDNGLITQIESDALYTRFAPIVQANFKTGLGIEPQTKKELQTQAAKSWVSANPQVMDAVKGFTSEDDLAARILKLGVDLPTGQQIYDNILAATPSGEMALRGVQGNLATTQQKQQLQDKQFQLDTAANNPAGFDFSQWRDNPAKPTQQDLIDYAGTTNKRNLQDWTRQFNQDYQSGSARSRGLMAAFQGGINPDTELLNQQRQARIAAGAPPINDAMVAKGGYAYAPGTRLAGYVASQVPGIASQSAQARQAWWQGINAPPQLSEREALMANIARNQQLAATAPTSTTVGDTYWGEGGLAGIAQRAYDQQRQQLAGITGIPGGGQWPGQAASSELASPDPTAGPGPGESDPFLRELAKRNLRNEYYRQPGAGTVTRLNRAVRFV